MISRLAAVPAGGSEAPGASLRELGRFLKIVGMVMPDRVSCLVPRRPVALLTGGTR